MFGTSVERILKSTGDLFFPIAVSVYLLVRMEQRIEKLTKSIRDLSTQIKQMVQQMSLE